MLSSVTNYFTLLYFVFLVCDVELDYVTVFTLDVTVFTWDYVTVYLGLCDSVYI